MLERIGIFFVLVGVLLVFITFASGKPNSQSFTLFCIGLPLALLGGTLWYRHRERETVERFRTIKKMSSKKEDE